MPNQEPVFVNVNRAQESIAPGWESNSGLLKRSTNTGCVCVRGAQVRDFVDISKDLFISSFLLPHGKNSLLVIFMLFLSF